MGTGHGGGLGQQPGPERLDSRMRIPPGSEQGDAADAGRKSVRSDQPARGDILGHQRL